LTDDQKADTDRPPTEAEKFGLSIMKGLRRRIDRTKGIVREEADKILAEIQKEEKKGVEAAAKANAEGEAAKRKEAAKLTSKKAFLEKQSMSATEDADKARLDLEIAAAQAEIDAATALAEGFKEKSALIQAYEENVAISTTIAETLTADRQFSNELMDELHQQLDGLHASVDATWEQAHDKQMHLDELRYAAESEYDEAKQVAAWELFDAAQAEV